MAGFGRRAAPKLPPINLPRKRTTTGLNLGAQMIMVFGGRGTGKTTLLASEAPDTTLIVDTHGGTGSVSCMAIACTDLPTFRAILSADLSLYTHMVGDEVDDIYRWLLKETLEERGFRSLAQVPDGESAGIYGDTSAKFEGMMQRLRALPLAIRFTSGQRVDEPRGKAKGKIPTTISAGMSGSPRRVVNKFCDHVWRIRQAGADRHLELVGWERDGARLECKSRLPDSAARQLPASIPLSANGAPLPFSYVAATFERCMTPSES